MLQNRRAVLAALAAAVLFTACSKQEDAPVQESVVNLYTHRHYDTDKALFEEFTKQTGIKVNVVKAGADELLKRLETEGAATEADAFIAVDGGRLWRAAQLGLLQPIELPVLQSVPANLRDPNGSWTAFTVRARVIVASRSRVDSAAIGRYADMALPLYKGKVLARPSENTYNQSLLASLVANDGVEAASAWAKAVVGNFAREPKGNDRDQVKDIAAGNGDLALVNTYYLGLMSASDVPEERAAADSVRVIFPEQAGRGAHIEVSGIGLTKHGKNKENARKLIEFLLSDYAQKELTAKNYEYPARTDVVPSPYLQSWGNPRFDTLSVYRLGDYLPQAVEIFSAAGWK
jgi:iron(III) transport system substrate-binding protein